MKRYGYMLIVILINTYTISKARVDYPILKRYHNNWAIRDFLSISLHNSASRVRSTTVSPAYPINDSQAQCDAALGF